ncbi:MAG: hypothetical protein RMJ33_02300 [Saprospiraceae bacterium]|nr:hypothetical protein [Saprospiraceae bacterium]
MYRSVQFAAKQLLPVAFSFAMVGCAVAQTFTAETGDMYFGDADNERVGLLRIQSGAIKKGEKLDIYAPTGRKFTATVVKITNQDYQEVGQAKAGEYASFTLKFTEDPSTGKDYLTSGFKVYPSGFQANTAAIKAESDKKTAESARFKATLDGKPFRGRVTYKGALLLRKGFPPLVDKPCLQLQFACVDAPDDRILTIQVFYPKEAPARYTAKDMEVNFSGAVDGNPSNTTLFGFVNGKAFPNFTLEITQWKATGNKALISGKINGELPEVKLLGRSNKVNRFENGLFEDIEVEIINE